MPIYHYHCPKCEIDSKSFRSGKEAVCRTCGSLLERNPSPPGLDIKETLDNGLQIKRVERLKDIDSIMEKRSKEDIKRKFGLK